MDPVTLAVLNGRIEQIADEMDATLFRSAFTPTIAEAHDACHGLYDAESGATLVQGKSGLPVFVGTMAFAVRAVIEKTRQAPAADGDIYLFNDAYDGGTHFNDFKLVRPYKTPAQRAREAAGAPPAPPFCYLASVGHWHDVGGAVPGNYNPEATECFQEAFVMPPVKLVEAGRLRSDVVEIAQANSRMPVSIYGDLHAQLAALALGVRRMDALLEEYGDETLREAFAALHRRAAKLMRAHISDLPDGCYRCDDFLDNDGIADEPLRIGLDLVVKGESLTMDFSRTAGACAGPVNIARSTLVASCYVALKHIFPDVPANAGVLEPVRIETPEASLLNARAPRPVGGYTETILRVVDAIFQAMAQAAPALSYGCAYGTINALSLSGHRNGGAGAGQRWVMFCFFGGGLGASATADGLNHANAPISTATIPPVEILEAAYPVAFTRWALRPDSAGPGQRRGGLGAIYEIELLEERADLFLFGERGRFAPRGVAGGGEGARNIFLHPRDDAMTEPPMTSKAVGVKLRRGQRVLLQTPGGGGHGPAAKRNPAAIARDLQLGYTSAEHAAQHYPHAAKPADATGENR